MVPSRLGPSTRVAAVVLGSCAVVLTGTMCGGSASGGGEMAGAAGSGGAAQGAGSVAHSASSTGHGSGVATTGSGESPDTCPSPFTVLDSPGQYITEPDGIQDNYRFLKRDASNNRCMMLYVRISDAPALGLWPSSGFAVEKVILSNHASDCAYVSAVTIPPPTGQTVEAFCGEGSFSVYAPEGALTTVNVDATFEFPQTYPWVPASETYCLNQDVMTNPGWVSGC